MSVCLLCFLIKRIYFTPFWTNHVTFRGRSNTVSWLSANFWWRSLASSRLGDAGFHDLQFSPIKSLRFFSFLLFRITKNFFDKSSMITSVGVPSPCSMNPERLLEIHVSFQLILLRWWRRAGRQYSALEPGVIGDAGSALPLSDPISDVNPTP